MEIPAAGFIESAKDMPLDDVSIRSALKELEMAVPEGADATYIDGFQKGYLLGLAAARVMVIEGGWKRETLLAELSQQPVTAEHVENPTQEQLDESKREMDEALKEHAPIVDLNS